MGKLRKFQGVLRDSGSMRVGMDELLPGKGGRTIGVRCCCLRWCLYAVLASCLFIGVL